MNSILLDELKTKLRVFRATASEDFMLNIKHLLSDLTFEAPKDDFRLKYHQSVESIRNQIYAVLLALQSALERPIRWAIMITDLFPETNELACSLLLRLLKEHPIGQQPVLMSRRPTLNGFLAGFPDPIEMGNWQSPDTFSSFDFILIYSNTMHLPLVHEIASVQRNYAKTVFMLSSGCVTVQRATGILKSPLVIVPSLDWRNLDLHSNDVLVDISHMALGNVSPLLDHLMDIIKKICLLNDQTEAEAEHTLKRVFPNQIIVMPVEQLGRMQYYFPEFEIPTSDNKSILNK